MGAGAAFKVDSNQIGKKLGKHVKDYGGNAANPADRKIVLDRIKAASQIIGVLAAGLTGGDAEAGAAVAANATQYNYLTHQDAQDMLAKQAKCASEECKNQIREDYADLDESRNKQLASTCQNDPQLCEAISARLAADDPKLLELAKQASANGDMGAATVIAYVIGSSNQDAQNTIATELAALKVGDDGTKFLAQLGATLLSAATGGGAKAPGAKGGMLGERGVQTASKTIWKGNGKERLDVENPNPGQRPGQIHYQDNVGNKYLYDSSTNSFPGAPKSVNKLLENSRFRQAIDKGMRKYLGE